MKVIIFVTFNMLSLGQLAKIILLTPSRTVDFMLVLLKSYLKIQFFSHCVSI